MVGRSQRAYGEGRSVAWEYLANYVMPCHLVDVEDIQSELLA